MNYTEIRTLGRVCVPVDPLRVKEFDPEKVPSVGQLLRELDALAGSDVEGAELGKPPLFCHYWHYLTLIIAILY